MAKKSNGKKKLGPPTKLTPENRVKLEQAAAIDASVEEMAYYCDVSRQTIYNWLEEDKALFDKIERLRQKPVLTARQTVAKGVAEQYNYAMDYLKRKKKLEFGDNIDMTTAGEKLNTFDESQIDSIANRIANRKNEG